MFGQATSVPVPPAAGLTTGPVRQPERVEPRAVESTDSSRPRSHASATDAPPMQSVKRLSESARLFAEVLETTGSVQVAASVSGFIIGQLDLYA